MKAYIEYDPRFSDPVLLQQASALGRIKLDFNVFDSKEPIIRRIPDPPPYISDGSNELVFPVVYMTLAEFKKGWPEVAARPLFVDAPDPKPALEKR